MRPFLLFLVMATAPLLMGQAPPKTHLKVGDMAPDFTLPSTTGKPVTLSEFRGKQNVVLAFYPAAFTGGCTKEMTSYGSNLAKFEGMDTQVFGVSTDNTPSQRVFAAQTGAKFPMLSDFLHRKASKDYGVLMEARGLSNRATFVIDKEGKIAYVEEGQSAVDISGAETACSRLKK
ncbi:MAG: peroxiredoxin [Bryobacteraceae bacterium]